jgi:hypothetical protein
MNVAKSPSLPELRRRVLQFRGSRPRRRLPEELWQAAVHAARAHGVSKVSQALGVGYYSLKERMGGARIASQPAGVEFLELPRAVLAPGPACVLELQDPQGTRLRAELRDHASAEALARTLWSQRG